VAKEKPVRDMLTCLVALLKALDELVQKRGGEGKVKFTGGDVEYRYSARYLLPRAEPIMVAERGAEEPLVDVFDEGDHIIIVASVPNVKEEDLKFEIAADALKIRANVAGTKIEKVVSMPVDGEVDKILGASFKNGVLEIMLRKKSRTPKEKGK